MVTGAGPGIGRAVALALLEEGYSVVLAGRRRDPLEQTAALAGPAASRALAVPTDVTDPASVSALFDTRQQAFGRLDLHRAHEIHRPGRSEVRDCLRPDRHRQRGHRDDGPDERRRSPGQRRACGRADDRCRPWGSSRGRHGKPPARGQHPLPHHYGHQDALRGPGMISPGWMHLGRSARIPEYDS
jgi:hypothetical protein